jgi:chemotaxis signal transduction protein
MSLATATQISSLIRCGVGSQSFGLDMTWVRAIVRSDRLRRQPGPQGRVGFVKDSEGDVPVYGLAALLGLSASSPAHTQPIVVLNTQPRPSGLLVDQVSQVIYVPTERVAPLPELATVEGPNYFTGVLRYDELVLLLAPDRLVPDCTPDVAPWTPEPEAAIDDLVGWSQRQRERQLVLFSAVDLGPGVRPIAFGLSLTQVVEVLGAASPLPVPLAAPFVHGLLHWRDRAVPVIDLAARLGLTPARRRDRFLIVRPVSLIAIPIEITVRVLRLPVAHQPSDRCLAIDPEGVKAVLELKNETVIIPDLTSLFRGQRTLKSSHEPEA